MSGRIIRNPARLALIGFLVFPAIISGISRGPRPGRGGPASPAFRVMTFNIRMNTPQDGANAWPNRKEIAAGTISFFGADIVGLQEALRDQIRDLESLLPDYAWVGVGRDDGREAGEFCPVFYLKNRFRLLDSGTFWLSEHPDRPGVKGWDAACARIVTWARLEDAGSGAVVTAYNTHFDHVGEKARRESARLLRKTIAAAPPSDGIAVTGDFNSAETDAPYQMMIEEEKGIPNLRDARSVSLRPPYGSSYSFNGYRAGRKAGERIDFVFVGPTFEVLRAGILSDRWDERFVSDHYPAVAEIRLIRDPAARR